MQQTCLYKINDKLKLPLTTSINTCHSINLINLDVHLNVHVFYILLIADRPFLNFFLFQGQKHKFANAHVNFDLVV